MADEKIAATEITPEGEETIATPEPKKEDAGGSPESVDYRAELEAERAKRAQAEKERDNYRTANIIKERKLKKRDPEQDEFQDDEEQVDAADDIAERVIQRLAPVFTANTVDSEIARYTNDPDKQALIKFHYENSIARKGFDATSVHDDVRKAAAITDAPRIAIERDEALRAASVRKNPPLGGSGRSPEDEISKKSYGWTADQVKSINEQHKLATGKPFTEQELQRAWDLAKTGKATAEIPRA